jgi:hypothetical protein
MRLSSSLQGEINAYVIREPQDRRTLERAGHRWNDNIKKDRGEI